MNVGVIDIGIGNLASVSNALVKLGYRPILCNRVEMLKAVDALVLPGVGAFPAAMQLIKDANFDAAIHEYVSSGRVLVGICLGMQLLFTESLEMELTQGLDLISGRVEPFSGLAGLPIPHVGWNDITTEDPRFKDFEGDYYFLHSYFCKPKCSKSVLFECNYGYKFAAAASSGEAVFGLQFHPEKSQKLGLNLLQECLETC